MVSLTLSVNSVHFAEKRPKILDLTDKNDLNIQISKYIHQFDLKDVREIRDHVLVSWKQVTWTKSFEGTNCCESTMYPANLLLRLRLTYDYDTAGCIEIPLFIS